MGRNVAIKSRRMDWRQAWGHKHKGGRDPERKRALQGSVEKIVGRTEAGAGGGAQGSGNGTERTSRGLRRPRGG